MKKLTASSSLAPPLRYDRRGAQRESHRSGSLFTPNSSHHAWRFQSICEGRCGGKISRSHHTLLLFTPPTPIPYITHSFFIHIRGCDVYPPGPPPPQRQQTRPTQRTQPAHSCRRFRFGSLCLRVNPQQYRGGGGSSTGASL